MRVAQVNEASISGVVQSVSRLQSHPAGCPILEFTVNSSPSPTTPLSVDRTHSHRCVACGAPAVRLNATLSEGNNCHVRGESRVNTLADTNLHEEIARIAVDSAGALQSCRGAFAFAAPNPPSVDRCDCDICACGSNKVRLTGKVLEVVRNRRGARVTLRTRALIRNIHDVWASDPVVPERLRVGSRVRFCGHLNHILRYWKDGQVRLVSGGYATSFECVRRESSTSRVLTTARLDAPAS